MSILLSRLALKNYRAWESLDISLGDINVLFGPNGAGKSSCLDALLFLHDCLVRDVPFAASQRSQGIGLLNNRADVRFFTIGAQAFNLSYSMSLRTSSGHIDPQAHEELDVIPTPGNPSQNLSLLRRIFGDNKAAFTCSREKPVEKITIREPQKLSLTLFIEQLGRYENEVFDAAIDATKMAKAIECIFLYCSRDIHLSYIKENGSRSGTETVLSPRCENLWSVLRNLHDRRGKDKRYNAIIEYLRESIPLFEDLYFEQTGALSLYGGMIEKGSPESIPLVGMSDGHLQMLIHLTALFGMEPETPAILMFDEPETSLHPWALTILGKAMKTAAEDWNRQIILATHSPVLLSQFEPEEILAFEIGDDGRKSATRVSEMKDIQDLLEHYETGSLYMAEAVAPQSRQSGGNTE
ncbi:MAG: AAA family ATPase [Candidatus Sumerlaeota bacterium]|nr:AAA family ATPase [Candidatus Sumerlaeota bacterium]